LTNYSPRTGNAGQAGACAGEVFKTVESSEEPGSPGVILKRRRKRTSPDSTYIPLSEAAEVAGFSRNSMKRYALNESCHIAYTKINGHWFIERKSLMDFLERVRVQTKRGRGRPGRPKFYSE